VVGFCSIVGRGKVRDWVLRNAKVKARKPRLVGRRGGADDRERPSTKRATQATSEHNLITSLSSGLDDNAYGTCYDEVSRFFCSAGFRLIRRRSIWRSWCVVGGRLLGTIRVVKVSWFCRCGRAGAAAVAVGRVIFEGWASSGWLGGFWVVDATVSGR
jgi:hypothetical protein